ncbi:MAG: YbdK family carboxylate-amine ligase [Candidatus Dormibacteria bacterium]
MASPVTRLLDKPGALHPLLAQPMEHVSRPAFVRSAGRSLGLELELQLVEPHTGDLLCVAEELIESFQSDAHMRPRIHVELMQNTVELVTGVNHTVAEARADLEDTLTVVAERARSWGATLVSSGSHPFANPRDQLYSTDRRITKMLDNVEGVRDLQTFGLHVHIGVPDGDLAIAAQNHLLRHLPVFLGLTNSSPYWQGRDTGLQSSRCPAFERLPLTGIPPQMRSWSDYLAHYEALVELGMGNGGIANGTPEAPWAGNKDIHYDVRPSPRFGSIELRICDATPTLREAAAIAALAQCLVEEVVGHAVPAALAEALDQDSLAANKEAAVERGLDALMVVGTAADGTADSRPVLSVLEETAARLAPTAARLGCPAELADLMAIASWGTSAERQRALYAAATGHPSLPDQQLDPVGLRRVVAGLAYELGSDRPAERARRLRPVDIPAEPIDTGAVIDERRAG